MAIDAVIRNFEIIGEATKYIPVSFRRKHPDIPWTRMARMRNRLTHEYFGVNDQILWTTAKDDLPALKPKIKELLKELDNSTL